MGKQSTSHTDVTLETSNPQHKLLCGGGIREGVKKRSQKNGVDVAECKDFSRSCPLLTQSEHTGETGGSLQQCLIRLFPVYCYLVGPDPLWKPQLFHHSTSGACRRARADQFVTRWYPDQQYQENKDSGTNQLHECLGEHHGLFCSDTNTNQGHYPCLLYCFGEEIPHIWEVPDWLCRSWFFK